MLSAVYTAQSDFSPGLGLYGKLVFVAYSSHPVGLSLKCQFFTTKLTKYH